MVAAVDLGSNSFHMLVARSGPAGLQVIDRLREPVRMAAGLDDDKRLRASTAAVALGCLERFGERIRGLPPTQVRVVGTSTFRRMRQSADFIASAEAALGHAIEIVSGHEEARLVYGGVTDGLAQVEERRLVIDIGGGSTELIVGCGRSPKLMASVHIGCVAQTRKHFPDSRLSRKNLARARLAAAVEVEHLERRFREHGWELALGSSGTIRALARVGAALGHPEGQITPALLDEILRRCASLGDVTRLHKLDGLREDRVPVFAGGLTVLAGLFDTLGIERMQVSDRALREGLLYDLVGRLSDHDVRSESVRYLGRRFQLDGEHAAKVEATALALLERAAPVWGLGERIQRRFLTWAAQLHEIGMSISHAGHHKHGAYILNHIDLHGFSRNDQAVLAALVRCQRGKIVPALFEGLPQAWEQAVPRLVVLLRLAVLLNRGRAFRLEDMPALEISGRTLTLRFAPGWLDRHPLTRGDLELEMSRVKSNGVKLKFS